MKILFLADTFPFPTVTGGKIRTCNILKQMARKNDIDFLCINDDELIMKEEIKSLVNKFEVIQKDKKKILGRIVNVFSLKSDNNYLMYNIDYKEILNSYILNNSYDLIYVDSIVMYQYIIGNKNINKEIRIILDLHNVENEIFKRMKNKKNSLIKNIYLDIEHRKVKILEKRYINDANLVFVVSKRDKNEYLNLFNLDEKKIKVIENGIDLNLMKKDNIKDYKDENYLLFVGYLKYRPNIEGINWFIKEIWPSINKEFENLKLYVIGKKGEEELAEYNNVKYLGFVPDLDAFYENAEAVIVPLKSGSGTRLKIVEAIKFKSPVISTTIGCEGLELLNGKEILIADNTDEYIKSYKKLKDKNFKENICRNAYKKIESLYDWDKIGIKINKYIKNLCNN